jgi:polysaccharide biosynthesis protein PelF
MKSARASEVPADICLILEGTYPYVSGGVSTWVHQLITAFPQWNFAIFYLGGTKDPAARMKYELPANVTHLQELYLFDNRASAKSSLWAMPASWSAFYEELPKLFNQPLTGDDSDLKWLSSLLKTVRHETGVTFEGFYSSPQTWRFLQEAHQQLAPDESFLNFYWTVRYLMEPLWKLARALDSVPAAKLYHCACTGYAGLLGALLKHEHGIPLLVSEHGIYLRERIQDICRSRWIPEALRLRPGLAEPLSIHRRLWTEFFAVQGRFCYHAANHIVSLFERNAEVQRHFGAPAQKITIIPNGIATESCESLRQARAKRRVEAKAPVVGFLGRVVSIKDVKTLLQAARLVCDVLPKTKFVIAGPMDEEPEYAEDCREVTRQLRLQEQVEYLGLKPRDEVLPLMDVMILSSVSEGLPFVILEAMACGIPVVSTDVGACRELVEGRCDESPAIGPCGFIAEIGHAGQLAQGLLRLLQDPALMQQMSHSGWLRVQQHYHEVRTLLDYESLYRTLMEPTQPHPTFAWQA